MSTIDKKDILNIETLQKILKSKKLGSIKIKKGNYEIEISSKTKSSASIAITIDKCSCTIIPLERVLILEDG